MSIENRLRFRIGDPTWNNNHLLITLVQAARTLIVDCGPMHLPKRIAHQVTDICISHRHMDHLMGFPSVARTLLASRRPIRVIGPRGIARGLSDMLRAFEWNYRQELSMKLDVTEVVDAKTINVGRLDIRRSFSAGERQSGERTPVLHSDAELEITAFDLDHHTVPCLGFAFRLPDEWRVDMEKVDALGVRTGPWLGELLRQLERGERPADDALVPPPIGRARGGKAAPGTGGTGGTGGADDHPSVPLARVADEAITHQRGLLVGYVSDTGSTPAVRARLREHLTAADVLFCEAFFANSEESQARKVGHLTSGQAGEIARELGVGQLVVTHISQRYNPARIMREVRDVFPEAVPKTKFMLGDDDADDDAPGEDDAEV
ncbi:MAG: MBL fold metallo-hydrolase [Planctomycetota bacterium]